MNDEFDGEGLCFFGGAPRSGLTLLRRMLAAHPQIVCGADSGVAPAIAMQAADFNTTLGSLHRKDFFLDESDVRRIFGRIVVKCLKDERRKDAIVCEKTSLNVLAFGLLADMLPKAKFVHVVRDGRDVVSSLLMRDWRNPNTGLKFPHVSDPLAAAGYWKALVEIGLKAEAALKPAGRLIRVSYEDIARAPAAALRPVFAFLGATPDADLKDKPHRIEWAGMERDSLPLLLAPITAERISAARSRLSAETFASVESAAAPTLRALGYL